MLPYRHTQPGTVVRWALLAAMFPFIGLPWLLSLPLPLPARLTIPLLALGVPISLFLLWSMTIEITATHFKFWLGPGIIRKTLPIMRIQGCEPVDGILAWGIHWAGKRGWLYNVSGRRAVALTLTDGGALMVGTDEPEKVCEAVAQAKAAFKAEEGLSA
jgi:hypothetical protein